MSPESGTETAGSGVSSSAPMFMAVFEGSILSFRNRAVYWEENRKKRRKEEGGRGPKMVGAGSVGGGWSWVKCHEARLSKLEMATLHQATVLTLWYDSVLFIFIGGD